MDVTPLIRRDAKIIQTYQSGAFKVSGQLYQNAVCVLINEVIEHPLFNSSIESITVEAFQFLVNKEIEVLLFGTGEKQFLFPSILRRQVKETYGFTLESMDNGAAARTYNALVAEGRRVAVILV